MDFESYKFDAFDDCYKTVLDDIVKKNDVTTSRIGNQSNQKILFYSVDATGNPRVVTGLERKPNYRYATAFANWVLSGEETMPQSLKDLNPVADNFDARQEDLSQFELPANFSMFYGPRISKQINFVIDELAASPDTRRAWISVLDGINDNSLLPAMREGKLKRVEYPCTIGFLFDIDQVKGESILNMTVYMRSQNMVSVWPYDYYIAYSLFWSVFDRLEDRNIFLTPGTINGVVHHAHVFERDFEYVNSLIKNSLIKGKEVEEAA